jgi:hypothetical protein
MHLAPFLCLAPGAYHKLNRLQWNWGKMLLGVRDQVEIRHALLRAQCGWELSLGLKMTLEVLAMSLVYIYCLPVTHCGKCRNCSLRIRLPLGGSRLEICLEVWVGHGNQRALQSVAFSHRRSFRQHGMHQSCAKEYCTSIARWYCCLCARKLIVFMQRSVFPFDWKSLLSSDGLRVIGKAWLAPRCWGILRISGRWPLPLFGSQLFPLTIFYKCGEPDATVKHALCACWCIEECYNVLSTEAARVPPRWCGQAFLEFIFSNDTVQNDDRFDKLSKFVAACIHRLCVI